MKNRQLREAERRRQQRLRDPTPLHRIEGRGHGDVLGPRALAQELTHAPGFQGVWGILPDRHRGLILIRRELSTPEECARADDWERRHPSDAPPPRFEIER